MKANSFLLFMIEFNSLCKLIVLIADVYQSNVKTVLLPTIVLIVFYLNAVVGQVIRSMAMT
jgi:hypothetical protein